jgi:peptide/nickel transport system permease protein
MQAMPYDFSATIVSSPGARNLMRSILGLDRPILTQYVEWMAGFFTFNLGTSYMAWPVPVTAVLLSRASRTLLLFFTGVVSAYLLGIWLGKEVAWRRGGVFEFSATFASILAYTAFAPFLAFVMLNVFGWYLGWFPYQKLIDANVWAWVSVNSEWIITRLMFSSMAVFAWAIPTWAFTNKIWSRWKRALARLLSMALVIIVISVWWIWNGYHPLAWDLILHMALPLGTVILLSFGETMLIMRTTMLETISEEYVTLARAKGLREDIIRDRHVARNAILPVLTRLMLNLPFILVGSLAIELIFQWDAMGLIVFNAIEFQDVPVLMGLLSFIGVLALTAHIVLDILHVYMDPRIRLAEGT